MPQPPLCQGPDPKPHKPKHAIPAGTVDCHCHVFEDQGRYPLVANRSYTPPLCTLADYLRLCKGLGIERTVQVNASVYGFDNAVTLDVIVKRHRIVEAVDAGVDLDGALDSQHLAQSEIV